MKEEESKGLVEEEGWIYPIERRALQVGGVVYIGREID